MTKARVVADTREVSSTIPEDLEKLGAYVQLKMLDVGDYVVGSHVLERKTVSDFVSSLFGGRLFDQARRLTEAYESAFLIVEGDPLDAVLGLENPRAYWGAVLSLAASWRVKMIWSPNREQTAQLILTLAKQVAKQGRHTPPLLVRKPKRETLRDWQITLAESLPGVGPKLAEKLLTNFGTPRRIFHATTTELVTKGGIGRGRAARIAKILDTEFSQAHDARLHP